MQCPAEMPFKALFSQYFYSNSVQTLYGSVFFTSVCVWAEYIICVTGWLTLLLHQFWEVQWQSSFSCTTTKVFSHSCRNNYDINILQHNLTMTSLVLPRRTCAPSYSFPVAFLLSFQVQKSINILAHVYSQLVIKVVFCFLSKFGLSCIDLEIVLSLACFT